MTLDTCWCGVDAPYFAPIDATCGGLGTIYCECGGDQCVCHWHGEIDCDGCDDCVEADDDHHGDWP